MAMVLLVSDAQSVLDELRAVIEDGETDIVELTSGEAVREMANADPPDLVIADCQVQNMGGIAICLDLKLEESGGRIPPIPVLLLLDRRADVFLAKRCAAEGFLVKPLDPLRIRKAAEALLEGGIYHDETFKPLTIAAG